MKQVYPSWKHLMIIDPRYALMMRQSCKAFIASPLTMALSSVHQVPTDYPISLTWHGLTRPNHNPAISASDLK